MIISYTRPIGDAWARMTSLLLRPFDLGLWLVVGFTAWLASFLEQGGSHSWFQWREDLEDLGRRKIQHWPGDLIDTAGDLLAEAWTAALVIGLVVLALVVALVLAWVGSRGQFMFLDNLVRRRGEVARPWTRFKTEGDSLFVWQLVYGLVVLIVLGILAVSVLGGLALLGGVEAPRAVVFLFFALLGTAGFVIVVTLAYVEFFLLHLIVPIMYRRRIGCAAAWTVFGGLFRQRPGHFVLYGLLQLAIAVAAAALILTAGLMTCCVGLLLLAIPYVGTVLTLPLPVFVRYLDLEWLGQFGTEFAVLAPAGDGNDSGQLEGDGTVVGTEDVGEDPGGDETRPQDS
jgi:hypothetical protein